MTPLRLLQAGLLVTGLAIAVLPATADSVQLANGDLLNGRVLGLDDKQLRLESETLGQVNIPRGKIVTITLGNQKRTPPAGNVSLPKLNTTDLKPEDVLKQLKTTGVSPKDVNDIQKMLPLLAAPEASKYFDDTVKGLLGGTRSIGDIRKDAMRARDELKKATKGLGPDVEAGIEPYLKILDGFIRETQPAAPKGEKGSPPAKK